MKGVEQYGPVCAQVQRVERHEPVSPLRRGKRWKEGGQNLAGCRSTSHVNPAIRVVARFAVYHRVKRKKNSNESRRKRLKTRVASEKWRRWSQRVNHGGPVFPRSFSFYSASAARKSERCCVMFASLSRGNAKQISTTAKNAAFRAFRPFVQPWAMVNTVNRGSTGDRSDFLPSP